MLRRSPATVEHQDRHHAIVLTKLIYYFPRLAGLRRRGRHQAERVLNAEVPYVRHLIGMDREGVRLHQPRCANASVVDLQRYVDAIRSLIAR